MSLSNQIERTLKKNKISFTGSFRDISTESGLLEILKNVIPERTLEIDGECIDSPECYIDVLESHAAITRGEFNPNNITAEGEIGSTIVLSFDDADKKHKLKIEQNGSPWISEGFYEAINRYLDKSRKSSYLDLPTTDQGIAVVYLPKKVAKSITKQYMGPRATDEVINFIQQGGCPSKINWRYTSTKVIDGYSSSGETIATALLKSDLPDYPGVYSSGYSYVEGVFETFTESTPVNMLLQNSSGETPYKLSRNHKSNGLKKHLEFICHAKTISLEDALTPGMGCFDFDVALQAVIEKTKPQLESMHFDEDAYGAYLAFSPQEDFIRGENQAILSLNRDNEGNIHSYKLFIQEAGSPGKTIFEEFPLDETDSIAELLSKFCKGELWEDRA
ncbi:hypothetical protein [Microbulbifer aggregans]|uniref:hypothetical protein n=1 Tax=Microbulbifer aggregans TaxID=1769779 RepID=UPI001CFC8399|nr:hypothetical protein [Microbulbifer aggregans]